MDRRASPRKPLLESALRSVPFRLLPGEQYPSDAIEKALSWQGDFMESLERGPRFAICSYGDSNRGGSNSAAELLNESLAVQSYRSFAPGDLRDRVDADYVVLCPSGTFLHPSALFLFAKASLRHPYALLYANELMLSSDGRSIVGFERRGASGRYSILGRNVFGPALVFSRAVAERIRSSGTLDLFPSQLLPWIVSREVLAEDLRVYHLPLAAFVSVGRKASDLRAVHGLLESLLCEYARSISIPLERIEISAHDPESYVPRVKRAFGEVQVVIPFRNEAILTLRCLESLIRQSCVTDLEVTLVNNGSTPEERERVCAFLSNSPLAAKGRVEDDVGYFNFARLNNRGVRGSSTPFILFLNNDVELSGSEVVDELRSWCALPDVGAVGGALRYTDGRLQHAGMSFAAVRPKNVTERNEYSQVFREVNGVTFAMAMVKRNVFEAVGGLDEERCPNGFGDALFCHELKQKRFRVLFTPTAEGRHRESASRGRIPEEIELMELAEAGVPIAELYDDLYAFDQPVRLGPECFADQPLSRLARRVSRSRKFMRIANGVASLVLSSREIVRRGMGGR